MVWVLLLWAAGLVAPPYLASRRGLSVRTFVAVGVLLGIFAVPLVFIVKTPNQPR